MLLSNNRVTDVLKDSIYRELSNSFDNWNDDEEQGDIPLKYRYWGKKNPLLKPPELMRNGNKLTILLTFDGNFDDILWKKELRKSFEKKFYEDLVVGFWVFKIEKTISELR